MSTASSYRLDGIYQQRQDGFFMQRVKLPAGVISADQARAVARVAARCGQGKIHLTTRGSMEIHWLAEGSLALVKRELTKVGLTSRGACGGAVRGITCGSHGAQGFPEIEALARRLQLHFTGNPRFERLPKKFKIGIEASAAGGRHLIQDVGLVLAGVADGRNVYDIWIAGGLGREPRPGFLLIGRLAEERLIPVIEAVIRVYAANAPPPKRLKFLAAEFGEEKLRQLIEAESVYGEEIPPVTGLPLQLTGSPERGETIELPVFAGELTSAELEQIAAAADQYAEGVLQVTANQDIALQLASDSDVAGTLARLQQLLGTTSTAGGCILRVCPGNHECLMGLAPTRDVARKLSGAISAAGSRLSWAISGCPNSCSQPQLADVGIVSSRLTTSESGDKVPLFDLYRRSGNGLGGRVHERLTLAELLTEVPKQA